MPNSSFFINLISIYNQNQRLVSLPPQRGPSTNTGHRPVKKHRKLIALKGRKQ